MRRLTVQDYESGQRLDNYLSRYMKEASRGFLYKMLRKKNITLNGKRADGSEKISAGDEITLFLSDETVEKFMGTPEVRMPEVSSRLSVLYEDDDVILVNKPAGMLSQKAKASDVSLCEVLTEYLLRKGSLTEEGLRTFRPGICNRLDRNTSGIVAAGKTTHGLRELSVLFRDRKVDKYYLCLAAGEIGESSRLSGYLTKDESNNTVKVTRRPPGDRIETEYTPLGSADGVTLLQVKLITGRTHQIRAHLASVGHPVLGDAKYGDESVNRRYRRDLPCRRPLLHAWRLCFPRDLSSLPRLAGRVVTAPPPKDFKDCLKGLGLRIPR